MTAEYREYTIDTQLIHAGQAPDPATGARAVPVYQTTSYVFHNADHAAQLFDLDEAGHIYSRISNPTAEVFEKRMAAVEGGVAAVATASGQSAVHLAIRNLAGAGDEIVASTSLYGGTHNLLANTLPEVGIKVRFVHPDSLEEVREAINSRTKAVLVETIGNPNLDVPDLEVISSIAHEQGVPLIVDNTFATPYICRPIDWGADIVLHSATKWIGGHGTSVGGVIVDSGRFNWANGRFPKLTEPDPGYHGIRYVGDFGTLAYVTKLRVHLMRDYGPCPSPFNIFLLLQGLETLHVRMQRHCDNAMQIARRLAGHPSVAWVRYPGLEAHPSHALAQKYLRGGYGSVIVFGIRGGREAGMRLIDSVGLWSHLANVGDAKSLIIHPASTTHRQMSDQELEEAGIGGDMVRLSVGIEGVDDLLDDLERAMDQAYPQDRFLGKKQQPAGDEQIPVINSEATIRWVAGSPWVADEQTGERRAKVIAIVGLSSNPARPSYRVARKLQRQGYRIIPVNPAETEVLGEKAYPDLASVPEPVDVVEVFRSERYAPEVASQAASVRERARVFWLQEGIVSDEAARIAVQAGFEVVMNRCLFKEMQRLQGPMNTYMPT